MTTSHSDGTGSGWFIALGILLVLTGMIAVAFPFVATLSVEIFVGSIVLAAGLFTVVHAFAENEWGGFFWQLAIGILYATGGICFLALPLSGAIALTLVLGAMFMVEGIARVVMAFQSRPERAWGWILASGGVSILLGVLILAGIANGASLAFIGLLVGVNFICAGASFVAAGAGAERSPAAHPA